MRLSTEARIEALVADLRPARRLLGPAAATWAGWAAGALAAAAGLAAIGLRPDLAQAPLGSLASALAPLALAWFALRCAFELATPGRSAGGGHAILALGFGAAWLATLSPSAGFGPVGGGACALTEIALAAVPSAVAAWLVCRRASVRPAATVLAAVASTLALGLVALEAHCAASEWGHRLVQHGLPVVLLPVLVAGVLRRKSGVR